MRRALVTVALALATSAPAAPVAAATGGSAATGNSFCSEILQTFFQNTDDVESVEDRLGHTEAAAEDAPKRLRKPLKRVIAFLREIVDGDRDFKDLRGPPAKIFRALTKITRYADEHCPVR